LSWAASETSATTLARSTKADFFMVISGCSMGVPRNRLEHVNLAPFRFGRFLWSSTLLLLARVLPGQSHRLAERVLIDRCEHDARGTVAPPGAALGKKGVGMIAHEDGLLFGRQLDHARLVALMERREDSSKGPE